MVIEDEKWQVIPYQIHHKNTIKTKEIITTIITLLAVKFTCPPDISISSGNGGFSFPDSIELAGQKVMVESAESQVKVLVPSS